MNMNAVGVRHLWRIVAVLLAVALLLGLAGCSVLRTAREGPDSTEDKVSTVEAPPARTNVQQAAPGYAGEDEVAEVPTEVDSALRDASIAAKQLLIRTAMMRLRVEDIERRSTRSARQQHSSRVRSTIFR